VGNCTVPPTPPQDAPRAPRQPATSNLAHRNDQRRQRDLARNDHVPYGIRVVAAWSWRLIVVAGLIYLFIKVIGTLAEVLIPVIIALLLSAVLKPLVDFFDRHHLPRALAVALALLIALAAMTGLVLLVVWQVQTNFDNLSDGITQGIDKIRTWLNDSFGISNTQLDSSLTTLQKWVSSNSDKITQGAVSTAATLTHVVTGLLIVLFSTIFFLKDGRVIWLWVVRVLVPREYEEIADQAGLRAWATLGGYVRATVLVAALDAIFIGLGVYLTGVPLAIPIGVLVFLFSFVPLFGATASGLIAVLIALVFNGPVQAVIVLAVVLGVQQIEGHVLQPVLMSRAVKVHPLAVVIGITTGVTVAGIIGALVAVPLIAMINTVGTFLAHHDPIVEARLEADVEGEPMGYADKSEIDDEAMAESAGDPSTEQGAQARAEAE
jgi:predicted PurR-regulated permease PerM